MAECAGSCRLDLRVEVGRWAKCWLKTPWLQVRTLVAHAGLDVVALKRVRIGGYRLPRELGLGQIVSLKPHEIRRISDKGAQANNSTINPYFTGV